MSSGKAFTFLTEYCHTTEQVMDAITEKFCIRPASAEFIQVKNKSGAPHQQDRAASDST